MVEHGGLAAAFHDGVDEQALRIDAKVTLDELAAAASSYGLPWTTGRVGALESGQVKPDLATLYVVAAALGQTTGRRVAIADLFTGEGQVAVNDQLTVDRAALQAALSGKPVPATFGGTGTLKADVFAVRESDKRMCKSIGVDADTGIAAMVKLWGRPFSAERDSRAEPGANAQRKGQVSRQLKAELLSIIRPATAEKGKTIRMTTRRSKT